MNYLPYITAIVTVLISCFSSYLVSKKTAETKIKEIKEGYSKSIHVKRLEAYPQLYHILSKIGTLIHLKEINEDELKKELKKLQMQFIDWDEKYAILGGPQVMRCIYSIRRIIESISDSVLIANKDKLLDNLLRLEFELKKEIGVFTAESFSKNKDNFFKNWIEYRENFVLE